MARLMAPRIEEDVAVGVVPRLLAPTPEQQLQAVARAQDPKVHINLASRLKASPVPVVCGACDLL